MPRVLRPLAGFLFWIGFALLATGCVVNRMWHAVSLGSSHLLALTLMAAALAGLLKWLGKCSLATALLVVGAAALLYFAGVLSVLTVGLMALAALGLGSLCVPTSWAARVPLSMVTGLSIIAGVDGWLLPFPVHFRWVYLLVFLVIAGWRWRALVTMLRPLPGLWSTAVAEVSGSAALAVLMVVAASTWAWLPTTMSDDLAYHLALPSQLAQLGYYQMNVGSNVWALAPWATDVLQGIAQVVAGRPSRGAVDMLWLGLSCVLTWQLCRKLSLPAAMRWLAVALLASLPLTMTLLHSMQTEGPTVAVMLALAVLVASQTRRDVRTLLVAGLLFGMLLAIKVSNVWFAGPLGLWLLWCSRGRWSWRGVVLACVAGLVVAGSSYVYAWVLTGNPVLPVFNGFFHSPWYPPSNFHDPRWDTGLHWNIVWGLVFHRHVYGESLALGPAVLLALAGCFVLALAQPRARALALVGLLCLLLPLSQIQYWRYAYPSLALLVPAMLCGVPVSLAGVRQRWCIGAALWLLVLVAVVFDGSSAWQVKTGALGRRIVSGKAGVVAHYVPVLVALNAIDARYGDSARVLVLLPKAPYATTLAGRAFVVNWYDPQLSAMADKARAATGPEAWLALFDDSGVNIVVTRAGQLDGALMQALLARHGQRVFDRGGVAAWRLPAMRGGSVVHSGSSGWTVRFDTSDAPAGFTLGHARVAWHCPVATIGREQAVVDWRVQDQSGAVSNHRQTVACLAHGVAQAEVYLHAPHRITGFEAVIRPAQGKGFNAASVDAKASLERDLTTQRNLAMRVWRWLGVTSTRMRKVTWGAS
ncbi:MAG TPA: hypothetical protein VF269_08175 [Rhodanobacteraceae bacterium]